MPKATQCLVKINIKQALQIREGDALIDDKPRLFKCVECGKTVRPVIGTKGRRAYFSHLKRNENCSRSDV